jgi:hypothetical protein
MMLLRGTTLPPHVQKLLLLNGIEYAEDLVVLSLEQLQTKTRLPLHLCAEVLDWAYDQLVPLPRTLWEMSDYGTNGNNVLQTGQRELDEMLGGGLWTGTLTELYGESGGNQSLFWSGYFKVGLKKEYSSWKDAVLFANGLSSSTESGLWRTGRRGYLHCDGPSIPASTAVSPE